MAFDVGRLRQGEKIAAGAAIVLFIDMFLLKWYGIKGISSTLQGFANALGVSTSVRAARGVDHVVLARELTQRALQLGFDRPAP